MNNTFDQCAYDCEDPHQKERRVPAESFQDHPGGVGEALAIVPPQQLVPDQPAQPPDHTDRSQEIVRLERRCYR
ncbi:MAG: hypothetical protein K6T71_01555 [Candidatus Bipolaricaulota bacterium]|nr:hypothetical protein [Candidatus Bipolaricaulota bacterium]